MKLPHGWQFAATVLSGLWACADPSRTAGAEAQSGVRPKWTVDAGGPATPLSLAAITDSVVIVGGGGSVAGVARATGQKLWSMPVPFLMPYAGVAVVGERLAAVVSGDGFISFDPQTGRIIESWTSPTPSNDPPSALPQMLSYGRILYASRSRRLIALDARAGRLDTLAVLPGDSALGSSVSSLAVFHDTVYAPVHSNSPRAAAFQNVVLYRLALSTRRLDSLARYPSDSSGLARWMRPTEALLIAPTDYSDPSWLGFDRATGILRWKIPAAVGSLGPSSQAALIGDTMYAVGNDGSGYVVDVTKGTLLRRFPIAPALIAGVAAYGAQLFVNTIDEIVVISRDGRSRTKVTGLKEGANVFGGMFAVGHGVAVIGVGTGTWTAFECP